jgi:hypothetical protein
MPASGNGGAYTQRSYPSKPRGLAARRLDGGNDDLGQIIAFESNARQARTGGFSRSTHSSHARFISSLRAMSAMYTIAVRMWLFAAELPQASIDARERTLRLLVV